MANRQQNGLAIRTIRALRKMSRDELAGHLNISYPYLTNIENEYKNAPTHILLAIAHILDVDVDAIRRERPVVADPQNSAA